MTAPRPKIAVFGATGGIGRLLQQVWSADTPPINVVWLGRHRAGLVTDPLATVSTDTLAERIRGCDSVLCLAGPATGPADRMAAHPMLAKLSLDAAEAARVPIVFLVSSAAVYGRETGLLAETTPVAPISEYGRAKVAVETVAATWVGTARPIVLRLGNVAGADQLLGGLTAGQMPQLDTFADGSTPRRSTIGPRTLADCLRALAGQVKDRHLPPILNVAAPGSVDMAALLKAAHVRWHRRQAPPGTLASVTLDTTLIETIFPFAPLSSTAEGIVAEWVSVRDLPQ